MMGAHLVLGLSMQMTRNPFVWSENVELEETFQIHYTDNILGCGDEVQIDKQMVFEYVYQ